MQFEPGQSGNPAGRPRGARNKRTILLENLLDNEAEAIARKAIELAKNGEMAAIRMCMDRLMPQGKGESVTCELPPLLKPADTVTAMSAIVAAAAAGDLTPAEAAALSQIVDTYLRALAAHGFDERLSAMEKDIERERTNANGRTEWTPAKPLIEEKKEDTEPEHPLMRE